MYEDRKQTGEMKRTAGVRKERSFHLGFPLWAVFFWVSPPHMFSMLFYRNLQTRTLFSIHFKDVNTHATICLYWIFDSVCVRVCRYCVWQVDWSVWNSIVSQTSSSWRSRTSSGVTLRRNGCPCSCPQQSSQSDRNTNQRWTHWHDWLVVSEQKLLNNNLQSQMRILISLFCLSTARSQWA